MHKKTKRGQIPSQVLFYIVALLVISMILLFGYKAIKGMREKEEQIILIQFKTELSNDIKSLSSDYGTIRVKEYELPSEFDEICFVDLGQVDSSEIINHPRIKDSVESGAKQNLFLLKEDNFEAFYIENLELSNYPYFSCIQSKTGDVKLKIEGKGNAAVVKTPPSQKYCQNAQDGGLCNGLDIVFYPGYKAECCKEYGLCC